MDATDCGGRSRTGTHAGDGGLIRRHVPGVAESRYMEKRGMVSIDPIHPGEDLAEILDELGISRYRLALATGVPPRRINDIARGCRSVTADTAIRIGQALRMTPEFWLNFQRMYDLDRAHAASDIGAIKPLVAVG